MADSHPQACIAGLRAKIPLKEVMTNFICRPLPKKLMATIGQPYLDGIQAAADRLRDQVHSLLTIDFSTGG